MHKLKTRDWYKKRIVRSNVEKAASAQASGSFWSKYVLHKKRVLLNLLEKFWESRNAVCEALLIFIRKHALKE